MKSLAEQMFNELGYTKIIDEGDYYILYESRRYPVEEGIMYDFVSFFPEKEQVCVGIKIDDFKKQIVERFDFKLMRPIIQQIKELGYLNDVVFVKDGKEKQ